MQWIFHDWSDEECIKLLGKCKEAIPTEKGGIGKVIIIEMVVGDDEKEENYNYDDATQTQTQTQLFFDMLMMTEVSGKERSEKEWRSLFLAAGFTHYNITPVLGLRSVIEVFP
ncbi:UNVERIFIED_CONTAM: Trans-resveratrol di-O-methyltransferase [Sesamum latifolium]|uniref:Trans-resveratrol di-O-methyltransferase n=1 Tax=Sesamum latifolium TaxID=2727402 RepID=A0AAW2TL86_9LAMI